MTTQNELAPQLRAMSRESLIQLAAKLLVCLARSGEVTGTGPGSARYMREQTAAALEAARGFGVQL